MTGPLQMPNGLMNRHSENTKKKVLGKTMTCLKYPNISKVNKNLRRTNINLDSNLYTISFSLISLNISMKPSSNWCPCFYLGTAFLVNKNIHK